MQTDDDDATTATKATNTSSPTPLTLLQVELPESRRTTNKHLRNVDTASATLSTLPSASERASP